MKREILRQRQHEDGCCTTVEKVTQTPEDGFVSGKEFRNFSGSRDKFGMFSSGKFKGHRMQITWRTNDPKIVRVAFCLSFLLVALLMVGGFILCLLFVKDPGTKQELCLIFAGMLLFTVYCFIRGLWNLKKKKQQGMEPHMRYPDEKE